MVVRPNPQQNKTPAHYYPPTGVQRLQQIIGCLLYYALAVKSTVLVGLSDLGSEQSKATTSTADDSIWLLNYAVTHPDAKIAYVASDMFLQGHSDASFLSVVRARSRAGGGDFSSGINPKQEFPLPRQL